MKDNTGYPEFNKEEFNKSRDISKFNNYRRKPDPQRKRPIFPEEGKILTGIVKSFNEHRSFGFVLDSDNNEYFVHYTDIKTNSPIKNLARGQHVKFVGREGTKGLYATDVEVFQA